MIYAAIDYSMTAPAITVHNDKNEFSAHTSKFFYLTDIKKSLIHDNKNFTGTLQSAYSSPEERFNNISEWAIRVLNSNSVKVVFIEGYSMGSKGQVFQIGENTGVLKHKIYMNNIDIIAFAPTEIKKVATGKGNADKFKMQEQFIKDTGLDLKKIMGLTEKQWSPSGDVIDSFYVMKTGLSSIAQR